MSKYTTYTSYQEAKIDNPGSEIYHFKHKNVDGDSFFFTADDEKELVAIYGTIFKCKPADYCMTLAGFFDAGHKLVKGDVHTGIFGDVYTVGLNEALEDANRRINTDDRCYILRAKALEKKEWKNGDECQYINDESEWVEARYVAFDAGMGYHVIFNDGRLGYAPDSGVRKLELEADKAKREALELLKPDNYGPASSMAEAIVDKLSNAGMLKSGGNK